MNPSVYLKAGDFIIISHESLYLAIDSLTQSVLKMKQTVANHMNAVFLLTTQKCLERSIEQQKPLLAYSNDDIYYNEPVLLYHLLSGRFLSYNKDIENKSQVELTNTFKENCKFSIKPIFKCQTIVTRKIRNQESVILSPAQTFNHDGSIAMVVIRNQNRKVDHSYVFMKKNQSSKFILSRKNDHNIPEGAITNIYTYQLFNIQTKKSLYMNDSQTKVRDTVTFEKNINQFGSYFDLRPKRSNYNSIGVFEEEIAYGMPLYLHSWKSNKYLSINTLGDICLTEVPNDDAEFQIECYSDLHLNKDSVIRLKHILSKKYISIGTQTSQVVANYEMRLIDTYLLNRVAMEELRLNVFINDAHKIIKQEIMVKKISYRNRKNIFKVLKQLVNFMYGDNAAKAQFMQMEQKAICKLSSNDQRLLANIGIIHTLVSLCKIFIEEVIKQPEQGEFEKKDKSEQETIIAYAMMSLVGICSRNAANTKILIQQMPLLYEALTAVPGIIESLYHLFKDSKQLLLILENTSHKIGRRDVPSMELLISLLNRKNMDVTMKCKILKLLQIFVIVNHRQKILGHQAILLKSFKQNKLQNVILPVKSTDHQDLLILLPQGKAFEQLQQIISKKKTFQNQLKLIKAQLQLLCSLCLYSNHHSYAYAKSIISEEMIYRYLKGNLQPVFKQVFMRLLIDIYLSNLSSRNYSTSKSFIFTNRLKSRNQQFSMVEESTARQTLLEGEGEEMEEYFKITPSHSKSIEKIQNLILAETKQAIINQIIDSSFYMNIKSLRKFFQLRILDKNEVVQFKTLLTQYIAKYSKSSFKEEQKKKIILQVIKIMSDYLKQQIQDISQQFICRLKQEDVSLDRLFDYFVNFTKSWQFFNSEIQKTSQSYLYKLIKESIQFGDIKVLMAGGNLLKSINGRVGLFIRQLKNLIVVDSKWSEGFFNKANKVKQSLNSSIQTYMNSKGDSKQIQFIEQQLNQLIKQLNYLYFQNSTGNNHFSQLTQNMFRQMNLLEIIINFLNESQQKFHQSIKNNASTVYSTCFEFIGLYLQDNRQNFYRFQHKYLDIKFVFEYPDRGQIKFLNNLIKMPNARDLMLDQIMDCIILSLSSNEQPNPYILLALINAISTPYIDRQRIQMLVQKMLREPQVFQSILKISQKKGSYYFVWSYNNQASNYHSEWLLYSYLGVKLLLILLQQSSQRTTLALEIQKYISIASLLQLLKAPDLLVNTSLASVEGALLKHYSIKLFIKIYMPLMQKQRRQIQNFLAFSHSTLQSISYAKQDLSGATTQLIDEVVNKNSDHGCIMFESEIKTKTKESIKQFESHFNFIYVSIVEYFPFLAKLLETFINSNPNVQAQSTLKKQAEIQMDSVYRKLKDYVTNKLTYAQLNHYSKEYISAIANCEDTLKRKLGFDKSIQQNQDMQEDSEIDINDYFVNGKIQNTMKCFKHSSNTNQRKIYSFFLNMFHSSKFKSYIQSSEQSLPIQLSGQELQKIAQMLTKSMESDHQKFSEAIRLFHFFAKFNINHYLKMPYNLTKQIMMQILSNQKEDPGNQKLCSYLAVTYQTNKWEIQKQSVIQKKIEGLCPFKDSFIQRLCKKIESEKLLYTNYKSYQQSVIYSQNQLLSYEELQQSMKIQLCLQWIRNIAIIIPLKIKQNLYSIIFMQIVDLVKSYCNFIKQFNSKYMSYQLYHKINLCLQIIFHYISGLTTKSIFINYLIERQIWNDLNLLLGLDDGWARNVDQLEDHQIQTFSKIIRSQLRIKSRLFLKQAQKLYLNTNKQFKNLISERYFPLLPMKSLFGEMKSNVIRILKEVKHFPLEIKQQLFSRIEISIINRNIFEVYKKHNRLFNEYGIPSSQIDIDYDDSNQWRLIAQNMVLENGVDLTSLKMHINTISGLNQTKNQYDNLRLEAMTTKKIRSAFAALFAFFRDFIMIFISCFLSLCRKKKQSNKKDEIQIDQKRISSIMNFFLNKLGRVEVITSQSQLLSVDFMVRPECFVNKDRKQKFIESINFISLQLKLQSIYNQSVRLLLYFQNQIDFYRRFNKFPFVTFLTKNFDMLTYLNFSVILAENIVLIANVNSKDQYFVTNSFSQPFMWLQVINTVIASFIMIAYCLKDVSLLIKNINLSLKIRSQSYGSNYNNYSALTKFGIKFSMVFFNPTFFYHLIYSLTVGLVFYNKLFAALLLLDIFFQIPTLKNLLMSIWRPKIQLILAIVSFVLVQYFFSIFMFFNFKKQTYGMCQTLGECFGFVFVTTYKAVGGFVGYLFVKNGSQVNSVNFFQIFQDIYVVLVFQIFFALILAIIIDAFSLIRTEQTARKEYLDGCCIVCNLDKTKFNSSNMSFKGHIAITHNIWNYFYYCQYIFHKSPFKRTPYERFIYLNKNANWLPVDSSFDITPDERKVKNLQIQKMLPMIKKQ